MTPFDVETHYEAVKNNWTQGNWNAWVVLADTETESKERCKQVPREFQDRAISHARTHWAIQGPKVDLNKLRLTEKDKQLFDRRPAKNEWWYRKFSKPELSMAEDFMKNIYNQYSFADERWFGRLGEISVNKWLAEGGVDYTWNNEFEDKGGPDFVVKGATVDVKASLRNAWPQEHWTCGFPAHQIGFGNDYYFFTMWLPKEQAVLGLGGILCTTFMDNATHDRKGDRKHSNFIVQNDMYNTEINLLDKPAQWLANIK